MPNIAASTTDGHIAKSGNGTWASVRDATDGDSVSNTGFGGGYDIGSQGKGVGSAGQYTVKRSFFQFNVAGISNITELTMSVYGNSSGGGRGRAVKPTPSSFAGGGLGVADFDAIDGFSAGNTMAGNVTDYTDNYFAVVNGVINEIYLNAAAVNNANANGKLSICLVGDTYDYKNVDPDAGGDNNSAVSFAEFPVSGFQPILTYVTGSAAREAIGGGEFTRTELRDRAIVTGEITADTDYEFLLRNNLNSQVYFNIEGGGGKDIFNTASIRTTTSDSGSNVVGFVSENTHTSVIVKANASASFLLSSSATFPGNTFSVLATNPQIFNIEDTTASGSILGVDLDIFEG